VVDEAHLISQWGQDFRPDYLRLGAQADALGAPVRLALTATAAPPVRDEIQRRLGLRDPEVVIGDFDRPQIELSVHRVRSANEKQREIARAASTLAGPGIVYAATHASAQMVNDVLAAAGHDVVLYHAGLSTAARREAMTAFLDGKARIIAATVAFGMGSTSLTCAGCCTPMPPAPSTPTTRSLGEPAVMARRLTRDCCISRAISRSLDI